MRLPVLFSVAACFVPLMARAADHTDRLQAQTVYQTIDHIGASDAWSMQIAGTWSEASRNRIADLLFSREKGIGLSLWRFNIGAGRQAQTIRDPLRSAESFEVAPGKYDWSRQAAEQWFLSAAKARGVENFLAFCNSPPLRLTRNGLSNSGADETSPTNLKPGAEGEFAAYLADILEHFRDEGILSNAQDKLTFRYVSPCNEIQSPWNGGQEGCRVDNETLRRILLAVNGEFARRGLATQIVAPECSNAGDMLAPARGPTTRYSAPFGDYLRFLSGDAALGEILHQTVCHHLYGSETSPGLERWTARLGQRLAAMPGWKIWMSEICIMSHGRDLSIDSGLTLAKIVHHVFATENASAFHWWLALSPYDYKDGLLYTDWRKPGDPESVLASKMLWALGNYSRFVRPGAVHIGIDTGEAASTRASENTLLRSAFLNPADHTLAVVYINLAASEERVRLALPAGAGYRRVTWYVTDAGHDLQRAGAGGIEEPVGIPARSVTTVVLSAR